MRDGFERGTIGTAALTVYLIGAGAVAAWFVVANARFRHKLRAGRIEPITGKLLEQYEALCEARGVKPIPVYFTDPLPSACLVGVFKPYIALPLTAKPQDAIRVLMHEVCHYKGKDHVFGVLRLLCCVVHWFNPLVWLASDMSRTDGELACDDRVVAALSEEDKVAYANVLVLAAARRSAPGLSVLATGMTMTGKKLKTRVSAILHRDRFRRGLALTFMIAASLLLVCAFATDEVKPHINIPVISQTQTAALVPADTEEAALKIAENFFKGETVNLWNDITDMKVTAHEYGVWSIAAYSQAFDAPVDLSISEEGKILWYNHGASGYADGAALPIETLANGDQTMIDNAEAYAAVFAETLVPGSQCDSLYCLGASKSGTARFFDVECLRYDENGAEIFQNFGVQVYPAVRVVYYINSYEMNRVRSEHGLNAGNNTAAADISAEFTGNIDGFKAKNRADSYASYGAPGENDLTLEEAVNIAVQAICKEYGENEEAFRATYWLEYGFVNHEYAFYDAPYWEIYFVYPRSGEALFWVYVHSPDGAILENANGNG